MPTSYRPREFNALHTVCDEPSFLMDALLWAVFFVGGLMGAGWALVQMNEPHGPDEPEYETFGISR